MKVPSLFTLAVVIAYHTCSACPEPTQLVEDVKGCLASMMIFINTEQSERKSKCPDLRRGVDCVDNILEACKDSAKIQGQYDELKRRMKDSRDDLDVYCASAMTRTSLFLLISGVLLTFWAQNRH